MSYFGSWSGAWGRSSWPGPSTGTEPRSQPGCTGPSTAWASSASLPVKRFPKNSTWNQVLKTLCILTGRIRLWRACAYSFEGEQLYLIVLAFKKPLDVLQDRGSSFQIPAGSLAHYSRPTDTGVSSVASSNATSYNHNVHAGIHTSCEVGVVALGPAGLALQPLKRPVGVCEAQLNHAAPT